jgi:hypothetical protein
MGILLEEMQEYLNNASQEQLDKDWEDLEEYSKIEVYPKDLYENVSVPPQPFCFNALYDYVKRQPLLSTDLPIKVNGKYVVGVKLTDLLELELFTD